MVYSYFARKFSNNVRYTAVLKYNFYIAQNVQVLCTMPEFPTLPVT